VLERPCHCGLNMKEHTACDDTGPQCLKEISVAEVVAAARRALKDT